MANIMSLKSIRNKTQRNGFDLSFKKNFTAKIGELLPVMVREVLPGDKFQIDVKSLLRTQPINTAAFARLRYYYDFYFVPYEVLWRFSDTVLSQMYDNAHHSISSDPAANTPLVSQVPYTTVSTIAAYLNRMQEKNPPSPTIPTKDYFGFSRGNGTAKLLEYLGYGNYYTYTYADHSTTPPGAAKSYTDAPKYSNLNLNLFPLLAYQKIYSDYYRDSQWERFNPTIFNVDWMLGNTAPAFTSDNLTDNFYAYSNMFDLRYCNWQKDIFHGVLPNQQYGDVSNARAYLQNLSLGASVNFSSSAHGDITFASTPVQGHNIAGISASNSAVGTNPLYNYSNLSVLALRQAEALQKYKEVALATNKSYKDQIEAHWGVKVTGDYGDSAQYLGGFDASIDINEVVNTNITGDNAADIAGKGIGVSNGKVTYNSTGQYGVLMCIFHCLPLIDYTTDGVDKFVTRVNATDFAIPELDSVGMEALPIELLTNEKPPSVNRGTSVLGYVPRYIDYKTDYDRSIGAFKTSLSNWIISFGNNSAYQNTLSFSAPQGGSPTPAPAVGVDFSFFKVSPRSVNSLFGVAAGNTVDSDQLLISSFFDVKAVRNLDVNGLPY